MRVVTFLASDILLTFTQHIPQTEINNYHRSRKCQLKKRHAEQKDPYLRLYKTQTKQNKKMGLGNIFHALTEKAILV